MRSECVSTAPARERLGQQGRWALAYSDTHTPQSAPPQAYGETGGGEPKEGPPSQGPCERYYFL